VHHGTLKRGATAETALQITTNLFAKMQKNFPPTGKPVTNRLNGYFYNIDTTFTLKHCLIFASVQKNNTHKEF
jgi:hypothetical protein